MQPLFLQLGETLAIHQDQIKRYGGAPEIRDLSLLQSAIAVPKAGAGDEYLHRDLFEMAAAYLYHITQNHPFVDGNKRTGVLAAVVFLAMNDIKLKADNEGVETLVRAVAQGKADKARVAEFFRRLAR